MSSELFRKLIQEEVRVLFAEAFRNFSLKKFKAIQDFDEQKDYVLKHLGEYKLGMGSARMVFPLGAGKVLKYGRMPGAYAQNNKEIKNYRQHGSRIFATIFDYDKNAEPVWIIAEAVQIISEHASLRDKFNLDNQFFSEFQYYSIREDTISKAFAGTIKKLEKSDYRGPRQTAEAMQKPSKYDIELLQKSFWVTKNTDLGDADRLDHWGFTADGRIVLVDSGV